MQGSNMLHDMHFGMGCGQVVGNFDLGISFCCAAGTYAHLM
jgi:hypothetical protein